METAIIYWGYIGIIGIMEKKIYMEKRGQSSAAANIGVGRGTTGSSTNCGPLLFKDPWSMSGLCRKFAAGSGR